MNKTIVELVKIHRLKITPQSRHKHSLFCIFSDDSLLVTVTDQNGPISCPWQCVCPVPFTAWFAEVFTFGYVVMGSYGTCQTS